jgi:hypothetical protein
MKAWRISAPTKVFQSHEYGLEITKDVKNEGSSQ